MTLSGNLFSFLNEFVSLLTHFAKDAVDFFSEPFSEFLRFHLAFFFDIPLLGDLLGWIADGLLGFSVLDMVFGAGLGLFVAYTIGKWITGLVI